VAPGALRPCRVRICSPGRETPDTLDTLLLLQKGIDNILGAPRR
jgi:hypothetical protein